MVRIVFSSTISLHGSRLFSNWTSPKDIKPMLVSMRCDKATRWDKSGRVVLLLTESVWGVPSKLSGGHTGDWFPITTIKNYDVDA